MRLSTGIILSILSANVFAIEHLNGAHSGSLLARRAVVADTDGFSLQKRNNDKEQEEQDKPKASVPNPGQEKHVHTKDLSKDDPHSDPNTSDDTKEGTTDSPTYFFDQDDGATGGREDVYAGLDPGQGRSRFVDAPGDSSSRVLSHTRTRLPPEKLGARLLVNEYRLFIACERVQFGLGGKRGDKISNEVYVMLKYALKSSRNCQRLYKDPAISPFSLKLPYTISDKSKETYKRLQDDVLGCIKLYISAINIALKSIGRDPKNVSFWLKGVMEKTNGLYKFILEMKPRYSSLLAELGVSDTVYLERLDMHIQEVETYKFELSKNFNVIEEMFEGL
ncbi:hypothetical protein BASA83_004567 [Batrachochytrium salamandrivorans]|nr:hypothetical protein BASA83_004567 [Batrachochytrium salamandrivorans]